MSDGVSRRGFLKGTAIASAGAALGLSLEDRALLAQAPGKSAASSAGAGGFPTGKIGNLRVSRLICGGNLISGFAHSRDLVYVSHLLKQYFTDDKVCDTFEICEENGINTAIVRVDEQTLRIWKKYRKERGGRMQWIAQVKPKEEDLMWDTKLAMETGAVGCYVHGGVGDRFVEEGKVELIGEVVEFAGKNGLVSGIGGHALKTIQACVKAGLKPDFFMKTLNAKNYWSAQIMPRNDSVWAETPEETIAFMRSVARPWIAFKILGAGAIRPKEGFQYVFENGADFACVGMFDFQVTEDVIIARKAIDAIKDRQRPWQA